MSISPTFQARLRTVSNGSGPTSQTAVAVPPSDSDPPGKMRVVVDGVVTYRDYDDSIAPPTR
jgi:hypothetical protein